MNFVSTCGNDTLSQSGINAEGMIVAQGTLAQGPDMTIERTGGETTIRLSGPWTAPHAQRVEALVDEIATKPITFPSSST